MREIRTYGLTRGPRAKALVLLYLDKIHHQDLSMLISKPNSYTNTGYMIYQGKKHQYKFYWRPKRRQSKEERSPISSIGDQSEVKPGEKGHQ